MSLASESKNLQASGSSRYRDDSSVHPTARRPAPGRAIELTVLAASCPRRAYWFRARGRDPFARAIDRLDAALAIGAIRHDQPAAARGGRHRECYRRDLAEHSAVTEKLWRLER